jgi:two-component system sensor histidine kinase UhpB
MEPARILIVENELGAAKETKALLENLGFRVPAVASTGKEAVQKAGRFKPDLILMDLTFPRHLSGVAAAGRIRSRLDIPVVCLAARSDKKTVEDAKRMHAFGCLLKPIKEGELRLAIEMALSRHRAIREMKERHEKLKHSLESEKNEIQRALEESEERHRLLVENMNEGIALVDQDGLITYINEKFLKAHGFGRMEVQGRPLDEWLDEGSARVFQTELRAMSRGAGGRPIELIWKAGNSPPVFTSVSSTPLSSDKGIFKGIILVITDITERRRVEEELHRSREELRNLYQHLHSVREEESKRIAREIHDELGQALTALKMDLSWLLSRLPDDLEYRALFRDKALSMTGLIDMTIRTVQKISAELRPGLLDDLGLPSAIEWQAQEFQSRTDIQCQFQFKGSDFKVDSDCATAMFRILQEALTNIVRHASASRVKIALREDAEKIELMISDNGRGITFAEIDSPGSLGIIGMRERLRPFGGELRLSGVSRKGTKVTVRVPKRGTELT